MRRSVSRKPIQLHYGFYRTYNDISRIARISIRQIIGKLFKNLIHCYTR